MVHQRVVGCSVVSSTRWPACGIRRYNYCALVNVSETRVWSYAFAYQIASVEAGAPILQRASVTDGLTVVRSSMQTVGNSSGVSSLTRS